MASSAYAKKPPQTPIISDSVIKLIRMALKASITPRIFNLTIITFNHKHQITYLFTDIYNCNKNLKIFLKFLNGTFQGIITC